MKTPTLFLILALVLLISACSSGKDTKILTGDVISRPSVQMQIQEPDAADSNGTSVQDFDGSDSDNLGKLTESKNILEPIKTKKEKEMIAIKSCHEDRINLGFKSCYNTTEGLISVFLKNSGYDDIPGLWFKIEVGEKTYYESTDIGLFGDDFIEYILDVPEWIDDYGSADRIVIIPIQKTSEGDRLCSNRALLLEPLQSCTKYRWED